MAKKKPRRKPRRRVDALEVSPHFFEPPPPAAVEPAPPDIPAKLIPVLRKKPIVIQARKRRRTDEPPPPRLATSPIAAALRKRAHESRGSRPKTVDTEVHLPAPNHEPHPIEALRAKPPPEPAPVEPAAPRPPSGPVRARGLGAIGFYGALLVILAVAGTVSNASLPWLVIEPGGGNLTAAPNLEPGTLQRNDLAGERGVNPYFDRLVGWPLLCYLFLVLTGLLLAGIDELPRVSVTAHRNMQVLLLGLASFLGFIVALTGARWMGLYLNGLLDEGPAALHLHIVPYVNLALGAAVFGPSLWLLLRRWRLMRLEHARGYFAIEDVETPRNFILAAAAILLLLPLLPFAWSSSALGTQFLGEAELASARNDPQTELGDELASYGSARAMLWLTLYLGLFALGAGIFHRATGQRGFLVALVLALGLSCLPILVGLVSSAAFHVALIAGDTHPSVNWVLPVGSGVLAYLYAQYVRQVLLPFVRRAPAALDA